MHKCIIITLSVNIGELADRKNNDNTTRGAQYNTYNSAEGSQPFWGQRPQSIIQVPFSHPTKNKWAKHLFYTFFI